MAIINGNDLDNTLSGTADADIIHGLGGDDALSGLDGDDLLDGGTGADHLAGADGNDRLYGGSGDDSLSGEAGDDELHGGDGNDFLWGNESFFTREDGGRDVIYGDAGDDMLGGGSGSELHGGTGDDAYLIDRLGLVVIEAAGEGTDTVYATVSFRLPDNVENLVLNDSPHDGVRGVGNALDNVITANNTGDDQDVLLYGAAGDDTLHGGRDSDDYLDGGLGVDTMDGGGGNDTYVVGSPSDVVTELADQGIDTVRSAISYHLGDNVEDLVLFGSGAIAGTGNALDNVLTGNDAANVLDGGLGADTLTGGGGADSFVFDSVLGSGNIDHIADFAPGVDSLRLDPAIFTGLPAGALSPDAFALGIAAQDADDRILYDAATGTLRYDPDGAGGSDAQVFATVTPGTVLSASDFLIG